jgi:hypothetical protein
MSNAQRKIRLINQITSSPDVSEEEIEELFQDLTFIFNNPFDEQIDIAISTRGAAYIEQHQALPN